MPNVMKLLQIPEDHYISLMVGFGYPEIRYARGVQREANGKIKRIVFTQDQDSLLNLNIFNEITTVRIIIVWFLENLL